MKRILLLFLAITSCLSVFGQFRQWYNPMSSDFNTIYGRGFNDEIGDYSRLPESVKDSLREPLWKLSKNSAGLSLKFFTNSKSIVVKYCVSGDHSMNHMPATGVSGVDLYKRDVNGDLSWLRGAYSFGKDTLRYSYGNINYGGIEKYGNEFELYLPLYNSVTYLEIGVDSGKVFRFLPITKEKPIVAYGTSITQGACASRPGMAWANILSRGTGNHLINLGFSGNGQLERVMFDILAGIDSKLYIVDCMPNMCGDRTPWIYDRLIYGVKKLRSSSDAPILLVEHGGYMNDGSDLNALKLYIDANKELRRGYDSLLAMGVKGLHYMTKDELGVTMDGQVDGVHPSDLGMQQTADAYIKKVKSILHQQDGDLKTQKAVKQSRDISTYDWNLRHEAKLNELAMVSPKVVWIGNSITHFWGEKVSPKRSSGIEVWNKMFKGIDVVNLGYGWDKVENGLWRVHHGEMEGFTAKTVFVWLGCNNLADDSDEDILSGLDHLADAIRYRQKEAKIYFLTLLPRRGYEERIRGYNSKLKGYDFGKGVEVIDLGNELANPDGSINESLFLDGVHPSEAGYKRLMPTISRYLR